MLQKFTQYILARPSSFFACMFPGHFSAYRTVFLQLPQDHTHLCSKTFGGSLPLYSKGSFSKASGNTTPSVLPPLRLPCLCPCKEPPPKFLFIAANQASLFLGLLPQLLPYLPPTSLLVPCSPGGSFMVVLFTFNFHKGVIGVVCSHSTMSFSEDSPATPFLILLPPTSTSYT